MGGDDSAAASIGLRLLGPFEVVLDRGAGPELPAALEIGSAQQRAVLAVLALRVNEVVSRDALLDALWGDQPPPSATLTLRSLVSRLRRTLDGASGFELVTREPGWVLRAEACRIDAGRFEQLAAAARADLSRGQAPAAVAGLRRALELWRGDALVDVVRPGYLSAEASRLDEARLCAIEDLAEAELAGGWAADALARLEPHVRAHPLRERATAQVMLALYRLGRQAEALAAFRRLRTVLADELGIDPAPALCELETRILRHDAALTAPVAAPSVVAASSVVPALVPAIGPAERTRFVGRTPERATLFASVARARAGSGGIVLIGGEPGIGKTRLAEEVAAEAAAAGMAVLAGHCYEMAGASAYAAVVDIVEAALAGAAGPEAFVADVLADAAPEVARLVPQLRRRFPDLPPPMDLPPPQERRYLFRCLRDVFARLAAVRPTVVLLDDLQWADEATLLFVDHLAPELGRLPLLIIATYRDADVGRALSHTITDLHRRRFASRIRLGPLSPAETGEVIEALCGQAPPARLVDALHAATEGNVFFLEEVFRDLVEAGRLFDARGRFVPDVEIADLQVPEGVRLVIRRRLERLSDDAQALLAAAAVAGRVFSVRLLEALGGLEPDAVLDALDEAEQAMLIAPTAALTSAGTDEFLFAHELIRQTLSAGLSAPRRRRAHLRAAEAMTTVWAGSHGEHAAEIAHQLSLAGDLADPRGLFAFSVLAGRRALATSAFEDAVVHFEHAAGLIRVAVGPERAELRFDLGRAHRALGRHDEALACWERSLLDYESLGDADAVGRVCREMGLALIYSGRLTEGEAALRRGLAALGEQVKPDRARLLSALGSNIAIAGDAAGADACYLEARRVADELGDEIISGLIAMHRSLACHALLRTHECVEAGLRGARALRGAGEWWAMADGLWPAGFHLVSLGRFAESVAVFEEFREVVRRVGHPALGLERRAGGPRDFYVSGDLGAFVSSIHHEIDLFNDLLGGAWIHWSYSWMGTALFLRGDWDEAETWFRRGVEDVTPGAYAGACWGSLFLYLAYAGRRDEAHALFAALRGQLPYAGGGGTTGGWALLLAFTEGLYVLSEPEHPAAWLPLIVEAQHRTGAVIFPYAPGQLLERIVGIAATAAGDHATAEAHFRLALQQADELPHRFEQLETRRFYARMLDDRAGSGDRALAGTLRNEAAEGFTRLSMPRHATLARSEPTVGP